MTTADITATMQGNAVWVVFANVLLQQLGLPVRLPLPQHEQRWTRLGLRRSGCVPRPAIVPMCEMGH